MKVASGNDMEQGHCMSHKKNQKQLLGTFWYSQIVEKSHKLLLTTWK